MPKPSVLLLGIDDYVGRLELILQECKDAPAAGEEGPEEKDEFLCVKKRVYVLLEQVRQDIHDRQALVQKRGNCMETILKGTSIRDALGELQALLSQLQGIHRKMSSKKKQLLTKEEMQSRYGDIRILKRHIEDVNDLFVRTNAGFDEESVLAASTLGLREVTRAVARADPADCRRELTPEEHDALAQMKLRDAELDKQVEEIGEVLDRLNPLARQIGLTAEEQKLKAEGLHVDVTQAEQDLDQLNKKLDEMMQYQKGTNCCCRVALIVILVCLVLFFFSML